MKFLDKQQNKDKKKLKKNKLEKNNKEKRRKNKLLMLNHRLLLKQLNMSFIDN